MKTHAGRRDLLKGAGALALAAALPAPASGQVRRDRVTLAWMPLLQSLPFCVARQDGLFDKAGLEVEVMRLQAQAHLVETLVAGRADCSAPGASAGLATIAESNTPGSLKLSGLQGGSIALNRVADGLIALRKAPIGTLADLRGRSLGHLPGASWRTVARHMIRRAGLDPDRDVRFVELAADLHAQALASGTVEAVLSIEPTVSLAVAGGTAKRVMTNLCATSIADPFFAGVSLLSTKFVRERPEVASRLVGVLDEATHRVEADFDKYRPLLTSCTVVAASQAGLVPQPYLKGWRDLGEADHHSYQAFVETLVTERVVRSSARTSGIILKASDFAA
ncbi:ABC transporter substrate-binding protein [Phreatobacter stygius]|uniref:ABC transporter substrate-binding protein n=1 Tax=Phreatobacter stygius TaxID=1940610 RepID=UPI001FE6BB10|nr:ABC transporter substrate-binding protein [Phreatobacter stygius]